MENWDEIQLIKRAILGSERAFERIVELNQNIVKNVINKMIANASDRKDVCQEVFIKVYKSLHSFKGESKLSTWIAKVAYTTCLTHLGKRKMILYDDLENFEAEYTGNISENLTFEDQFHKKELMSLVNTEINKLPIVLQTIIVLYHQDAQSYEEIAEITSLPIGTVKSYLHRGRNLLRQKIFKLFNQRIV